MPRSGAHIRPLNDDDFDGFARIWATRRESLGLSRDVAERMIAEGRLREACDRDNVDIFVAVVSGSVVGYTCMTTQDLANLVDASSVTIEQLFVLPPHRFRGIARQLLLTAATHAQRIGAEQMTCAVPTGAREANRMLARLGFAPSVTCRIAPTPLLLRRLRGHTESSTHAVVHARRSLRSRLADRAPATS